MDYLKNFQFCQKFKHQILKLTQSIAIACNIFLQYFKYPYVFYFLPYMLKFLIASYALAVQGIGKVVMMIMMLVVVDVVVMMMMIELILMKIYLSAVMNLRGEVS